jgi:hypothetical protein
MAVVYPVSRLLSQPKIFNAIANYLGGPDAETLRSAFFDMLEFEFEDLDPDDCEFDAEEISFETEDDGAVCTMVLDNGFTLRLEAVEGESKSHITNDSELSAAFAINRRLITAIEESHPELKDDIAIESPPTPGNNFLSSQDGDHFEGVLHLRSNPDKKYAFNVLVVDPDSDELKASIKPM